MSDKTKIDAKLELAALTELEKKLEDRIAYLRGGVRDNMVNAYESVGMDRVSVEHEGQKVASITLTFNKAGLEVTHEEWFNAALEDIGMLEEKTVYTPVKGWEDEYTVVGDKVVLIATGEAVDYLRPTERSVKGILVKAEPKTSLIKMIDSNIAGLLGGDNG